MKAYDMGERGVVELIKEREGLQDWKMESKARAHSGKWRSSHAWAALRSFGIDLTPSVHVLYDQDL